MLVGLIPAAGYATRLGPRPLSKEVIPIGGRPVMDHLVERMRAAGANPLRVVTRPDKVDVVAHAEELGADVVLGRPADAAASLLAGLVGLADGDEVLLGYPDTLWEPVDGYLPLLERLRAGADVALGLFGTPDLTRSDVVVCGPGERVREIAVKPTVPPSDRIWGIAAAHAGTLRGLREGTEPGVTFARLAASGDVRGVWLSDEWLDIGTPAGLERAMAR